MQSEVVYDHVFDAQQHYRLILDSMARPGKINTIPSTNIDEPAAINNASALIAFALLNTDASFCSVAGGEVEAFIALHTSAVVTNIEHADFVFVQGLNNGGFIPLLKTGTLPYPENSATIIADVTRISDTKINASLQLILKGPGVNGTATVYVSGLNPVILDGVKEQNLEFPLGIDLILADRGNRIICIPRSNNI